MKYPGLLLLLCAFLLPDLLSAQQPVFRNYSVDNGLPSSEVYQVIQDKTGFLWFATDRGLSRFDGQEFFNYTTSNGLCDNSILGIEPGPDGSLLLKTFSGKLCLIKNGKVVSIHDSEIRNETFFNALLNGPDTIWHNSYHPLPRPEIYYYSKSSGATGLWNPGTKNMSVYFYSDREYSLSTGTDSISISRKDSRLHEDLTIYFNRKKTGNRSFKTGLFHCLQIDSVTFLAAFDNHVLLVENGKISYKTTKNRIIHLSHGTQGEIWVGYFKGGAGRYSDAFTFVANCDNEKSPVQTMLSDESVSSVLRDAEGGYWFTTLENGVYYTQQLSSLCYTSKEGLSDKKVA
ncbi:MAG: two-component regulator propeller domain-containing protein, partial [Bacteroidota bacterium]